MLKAVCADNTKIHTPSSKPFKGWYEDEITSAVFGPLSYMPKSDQILFLRNFLFSLFDQVSDQKMPFSLTENDTICFNYWPRWKLLESSDHGKLPDLFISIDRPGGKNTGIIIEIKWDAEASSKTGKFNDQLLDQWIRMPDSYSRDYSIQIYLVRELRNAEKELLKTFERTDFEEKFNLSKQQWQLWKSNIYLTSWSRFSNTLHELTLQRNEKTISHGLLSLVEDIIIFLDRLGVPHFVGFNTAFSYNNLVVNVLDDIEYSTLFWIDWVGFLSDIYLEKNPNIIGDKLPLFWADS